MSEEVPELSVWHARGQVKAVALVLHGGTEVGTAPVGRWKLAYLRMIPLARALHRAGAGSGLEVRLMRNRLYGWNAPVLDPVSDARWALERIRAEHPGLPVVLIGHSMGGRVAMRVADDPAVVAVCGLAPWTPPGEPVDAVAGRAVLIAHGTRDRMTDPAASHLFAERALSVASRLVRFDIAREGHAMLRRSAVWTRLMCAFTLEAVAADKNDETLSAAWTKPSAQRLRIPV
ncbi:alpha/beta hydrolase [Amycolatopsis sp. H20-H5]|uniref:alpha/beta hydrolase n=1 Tax=Amycolatopsis sp. H20-H5 TaxID=3046309 RepID=UPI002DB5C958|nr:alpha/beta fold hydrolase [Amycolatopsis sp. H20-H5]MEC3976621.1 alpha/beta fold hydrolase [Amycolatopsis sp. H20-H5]